MGKRKKKQKSQSEEVIVIDLNDDDADLGQDETTNATQGVAASRDADDCIDLTEPDAERQGSDHSSQEVLLIEDHESEWENRTRKQSSAYEIMRQCSNTVEQLRGPSWKDVSTTKSSKKKKKMKASLEDKRKDTAQDKAQKKNKRSPRSEEKTRKFKERLERGERSQDDYDQRHSPRKKSRDRRSPDRLETVRPFQDKEDEDTHLRRSPRKRRQSRSRDRKSRSRDRQINNSGSPIGAKQKRQERNDNFDDRNGLNSERSMHFEKNQNRWEKRPTNYNNSGRDDPENPMNSSYAEREDDNRGNRRTERSDLVQDDDNVDGPVEDSRNISAVAVPTREGALVILPHPSQYILKGKAIVQALVGSISILGHTLKDPAKTYDMYSPECTSLVKIETVSGERSKDCVMESVSSQFSESEDTASFQKKIENFESVIVLKISRLNSTICDYVTTLTPYQNLFVMGGNRGDSVNKVLSPLGVSVFQRTWQPHVMLTNELREAIADWNDSLKQASKVPPCMMVVGGKDSGKSTTNRLLINSSLNSIEGVYFLECDIGQTEFTPPGCVSLQYVTQPVLGPPFSHQRKPLCSYFFGGVTPNDDPSVYLECVQRCVQHYQQLGEPGPLIVNTMGWVKGLGLQLLVDTMRLVCPSHVVQLWCQQKHHNCDPIDDRFHLQQSWQDVTKEISWRKAPAVAPDPVQSARRQHKLTIIDSISKSVDLNGMAVRLKPIDFRNLSLLSHLYSNLDPHMTLTSAAPYTLSWKDVGIHICYMQVPREQIMYSLNASVVALCHADLEKTERPAEDSPMFFRTMPICEWIGFGIVRGVDPVMKELYIVTSVDLPSLKRVNTLLKGSVNLPEQVLMKQHCHGNRLYVDDAVQSLGSAAVKPRRHMPRTRLENSAASPGPSTSSC